MTTGNWAKGVQGFIETEKKAPADTALSPAVDDFAAIDAMDVRDRWVLHNVLLAQVDDNHAGGVMNWSDDNHEAAAKMFETLEHRPDEIGMSPTQTRAALLSLVYVVADADHPDMAEEEWEAAESMLSHLSRQFGR